MHHRPDRRVELERLKLRCLGPLDPLVGDLWRFIVASTNGLRFSWYS